MAKRGVVRELELMAEQLGFVFDGYTGSGHIKFRHSCSQRLFVASGSPSCHRSSLNSVKEMERISGVKLPRHGQKRKSSLN